MEFTISNRAKKITMGMVVVGLIATIVGFLGQKEHLHPEVIDDHTVMVSYHHEVSEADFEGLKASLTEQAAHHNLTVQISDASHGDDRI